MDEIEAGFKKLTEKIDEMTKKTDDAAKKVKENDVVLIEKMAGMALPVIRSIGLNML
jgi:predicted P-loop ATPase/GTPase